MRGRKGCPENQGSSDSSSDEEFEVDERVWRLKPRVNGNSMPDVCLWQKPLTDVDVATLALEARKVFRHAHNTSFWVPASRSTARTLLEQFALGVFWFHAKRLGWSDAAVSRLGRAAGAEYWVQRRTIRQPKSQRGVNWHFDKDEDLLDDFGMTIHPLLGTATYLTRAGAPLMVLSKPVLTKGPEDASLIPVGHAAARAYCIQPRVGRHVAFHGDMLHGCPPELEANRGERLSVLVNVWLHHRPLGLKAYPHAPATSLHKSGRKVAPASAKLRAAKRFASFRPSKQEALVAFEAVGNELPVTLGPWQISGVRLPRRLDERRSKGSWVAHQARGQVSVSELTPMRGCRKRPAAS